jgi:hypothetical protein
MHYNGFNNNNKSAGGREAVEATDPAVSRQVMPELMVKMAEFKMASDGQTHVILIKG